MLAVPLAKFAVGVNTAVRVRPVPLIALSVPPETTRSPAEPFHVKVLPGSSENMKVMLAVSPALSAVTLLTILTVGARVSMLMLGVVAEIPRFPALSV